MKYLMQKPILAIGIIMFSLFLYQVANDKQFNLFNNDRFTSNSCKALLVKLEKDIPGNWKAFCEGNNLAVEINEVDIPKDEKNIKSLMYRELANHMSFVARTSYSDFLEKIFFVRFKLMHPKMEINAVTEGKFLIKLKTLENPQHIMSHLKSTVQVKEELK